MNKHKHAELMLQYAQDAQTTDKPWELWQYQNPGFTGWASCYVNLEWAPSVNYRRKPVPKTNLQVARELLDIAHRELEEYWTTLPNVYYVQGLLNDVQELLQEPEGVAVPPPKPCAECGEVKVTTVRCSFCDEGEGRMK